MDAERLIGSLLRGALGGRRKRSRGALRFLTGGRGSFLNVGTLLTLAGVGWGLYEATRPKTTVAAPPTGAPSAKGTSPPPPAVPATLPPLPVAPEKGPDIPAVSDSLLRLVRLTISAARADGELSPEEKAQILTCARGAGVEALVEAELQRPVPLVDIVYGIAEPQVKADLYVLAFTIVRADEGVSGAERIYLAQLAGYLGLDEDTTTRLEAETAARIEQAATQSE